MKRILFTSILVLFVTVLFSQTKPVAQNQEQAKKIQAALNLTPQQTASFIALDKEYKANVIKAFRANKNNTPEVRSAAIQKVTKEHKSDLKALLTKEQLAKYQQMKGAKKTDKSTQK